MQIPVTEKQKKHSKLLKKAPARKLRDLAASATADINIVIEEPFIIYTEPPPPHTIQTVVCHAGAMIVGVVNDSSPQLTEDESFLFTEYAITVEDVAKDNAVSPIQRGSRISVVRDGGTGLLNGRRIHARVEGFKSFAEGKRYILFLRFIPETGAYVAYANGSFEISNEKVIPLGRRLNDQPDDASAFLNRVRTILSGNNCINSQSLKGTQSSFAFPFAIYHLPFYLSLFPPLHKACARC